MVNLTFEQLYLGDFLDEKAANTEFYKKLDRLRISLNEETSFRTNVVVPRMRAFTWSFDFYERDNIRYNEDMYSNAMELARGTVNILNDWRQLIERYQRDARAVFAVVLHRPEIAEGTRALINNIMDATDTLMPRYREYIKTVDDELIFFSNKYKVTDKGYEPFRGELSTS